MSKPSTLEKTVRTVRMSDEDVENLLDRLEAETQSVQVCHRGHPRFRYRSKNCIIRLQQPGDGDSVPYSVPTRNLSGNGLSFLHGGFVHPRTACSAQLITTYGTWDNMQAKVVACRYLEGSVHEVGIAFEQPINVEEYVPSARRLHALLAEDSNATARILLHHLSQLNVKTDHVTDGRQAVDAALAEAYDVLLLDMSMPVLDGFGAARELRERNYAGVIVAVTALTAPEYKEQCLEVGCDHYLPKPCQREELEALINSLHAEPVLSSFHHDEEMQSLLDSFVADLPGRLRRIEEARHASNIDELTEELDQLKAECGSYGFEPIESLASRIVASLRRNAEISDITRPLEELAKLCLLARTGRNRA